MAPFFLVAHSITYLSAGIVDGYSFWYVIFVHISTFFYLFIGLLFLKRLLNLFDINNSYSSIILLTFVFGTNMFYYTVSEPTMSHVYSFAFVTIFLYYVKRYFTTPYFNYALYASLALGMISLIRPVNSIIILSLPFLAHNPKQMIDAFKLFFKKLYQPMVCVAIVFLIGSIQLIIYKLQTGDYLVYSYNEEGFNWLKPEMFNVLFSYNKGLFIYTPIIFISLFGLWKLIVVNRFRFFTFLFFFISITYVFSSWWNWWYGGNFGMRVYIEYYSLFAILLGTALIYSKPRMNFFYIACCFMCIIICQIQIYQYRYHQMYWLEMNKENYWKEFLRIDKI